MAYIKVIEHENAEGELLEIYNGLVKSRGKLAEVHKIQSLNPKSIVHHMDLYMGIMFGKSPLKRYQRELIAVVVSVANKCPYCLTHHGEALLHFWKDEERLKRFVQDYKNADLSEVDLALSNYAHQLTVNPSKDSKQLIEKLKSLQLDDRAILDCSLVTSYFNFVNIMVLGLGVHLEEEGGQGYQYD